MIIGQEPYYYYKSENRPGLMDDKISLIFIAFFATLINAIIYSKKKQTLMPLFSLSDGLNGVNAGTI